MHVYIWNNQKFNFNWQGGKVYWYLKNENFFLPTTAASTPYPQTLNFNYLKLHHNIN